MSENISPRILSASLSLFACLCFMTDKRVWAGYLIVTSRKILPLTWQQLAIENSTQNVYYRVTGRKTLALTWQQVEESKTEHTMFILE
jgi:hypothetical protein